MNKLENIFSDKKMKTYTKIKIFNALVASIFLYNLEIWAVNQTTEKLIDSYQRRLLRAVLNIRFPNKIINNYIRKPMKLHGVE